MHKGTYEEAQWQNDFFELAWQGWKTQLGLNTDNKNLDWLPSDKK